MFRNLPHWVVCVYLLRKGVEWRCSGTTLQSPCGISIRVNWHIGDSGGLGDAGRESKICMYRVTRSSLEIVVNHSANTSALNEAEPIDGLPLPEEYGLPYCLMVVRCIAMRTGSDGP